MFSLALGLLLTLIAIALLAGGSWGEGTVLVNLGSDVTTQEDTINTFTPWVSYTGTKGLTYVWDFGDGTGSSVERPSHKYTKASNYTVSLTVTDSDGVSDSDSLYVEVLNVRPIAEAGGNKTVAEGTTVTFDGSSSWDTPSDLPLLTYEWDFGDGTGTSISPENKVVTHTYAEAGVYITRLVVRDDDWTESNFAFFDSQLVTVSGSSSGNGTLHFWFDVGNGSANASDPGGSIAFEVYWDFGDGSWVQGNSASHEFESDGVYIVTLIVTDAFGSMSVHNILVTVLNDPPTAEAGPDWSVNEDEAITFAGQGSDPGGGDLTFDWDFGDGHTGSGQNPTHAYTNEGTYTAQLTVTDADGLADTDTCTVDVANVAPVAVLTSDHTTDEGDVVTFSASSSTDTTSDLPLLTYEWSFGDGATATGRTVTHAYADEGTYTVTLIVTDDNGASDTSTTSMSVSNAAPVVSIDSVICDADPILPLDNITFSGSATDKGTTDTLTYSWDFGDGSGASTAEAVHNYSTAGTYTVKLTVTDDDGASTTASTTVTVATVSSAAEEAQDIVETAPASSFDKPQDQVFISGKFDDLLSDLATGKLNQILSDIHVLEVQIGNKVTDAALREALLEYLANIEDSL